MIKIYPKAMVLTNRHPFGGTDMMAQSLASALNNNGYDTVVIGIEERRGLLDLMDLAKDPHLALVLTTGTLPLQVKMNDVPVWKLFAPAVQFLLYLVDAWPYDYVRVDACRAYLNDWPAARNLHVVVPEANDARLVGKRAHYMPTGAYPAPRLSRPKAHPERLMIWASANKELAVTPFHSGFEQTLMLNNFWGLDAPQINRIAEALRHTEIVHGMSAIAAAFGEPLESFVKPESMIALCAIDSCLKRYRRVKVVQALKGYPLDIYGENWEQYVANVASFRLLTPDPNHNHVFSYLCQEYAGVFNFDPNFGHGTNERAVSALSVGIPIANNFNPRTNGSIGCIPYHFSDESIRHAASRLLAYKGEVPLPAENTWEYLIGKLLGELAAEGLPS